MMTLDDQIVSARTLRNFVKVGVPIEKAVATLSQVMPKYADQWQSISAGVGRGAALSDEIQAAGLWPEGMVAALKAGELSGRVDETLTNAVRMNEDIKKMRALLKKAMTPLVYVGAGIGIFVVYVLFVFPAATKAIQQKDRVGTIETFDNLRAFLVSYWWGVLLALGVLAYGIYSFFQVEENRIALVRALSTLPLLGGGLNSLYCGMWCRYYSTLDKSGDLPTEQMVSISNAIIPAHYRESFTLMAQEANSALGLEGAVDVENTQPDDPRRGWPPLLRIALKTGAETGEVGQALEQVAEPLIEDGTLLIQRFLSVANLMGMGLAASAIVSPMLALVSVQLSMVQKMGGS